MYGNRTHTFIVRMNRELFEQVRTALAIEYPPKRPRDEVGVGAWPNLIEQVLIDWLAQHRTRLANRDAARSFAHDRDNR